MCLRIVTKKVPKEEGIFWKWFWKRGRRLRTAYMGDTTPQRRWLQADTDLVIKASAWSVELGQQSYRSGFHGFANWRDAIRERPPYSHPLVLRACKYRGDVTIGKQFGNKVVIVAPEMYVLPEKESQKLAGDETGL